MKLSHILNARISTEKTYGMQTITIREAFSINSILAIDLSIINFF